MIVITSSQVAGKSITETLGMVRGVTVRAHHVGNDLIAYATADITAANAAAGPDAAPIHPAVPTDWTVYE